MRGLNVVALSGNVNSINFSTTKERGDDVCTFCLAIEKVKDRVTWVRINVYGGAVEECRKMLVKGNSVVVEGELMNRHKNDLMFTEIRAKDIKFL